MSGMRRSRSQVNVGDNPSRDVEEYGKILESFDAFQTEVRKPRRRASSAGEKKRSHSSRRRSSSRKKSSSERGLDGSSRGSRRHRSGTGKSVVSAEQTVGSASASDVSDMDEPDLPLNLDDTTNNNPSIDLKVRNRALVSENRRLHELVQDFEKRLSVAGFSSNPNSVNNDDFEENSVSKLKSKIKSLKNKRKQDKMELLQMKKSVDTHASEIDTLRQELGKSLQEKDQLEASHKDAQRKLSKYERQLAEANQQIETLRSDSKAQQLEAQLQKRDGELEVTLELLQSKVERIIQLEYEVQQTKDQLHLNGESNLPSFNHASVELMKVDAECKSLRRQNMMLKLVVEELQEAHRLRSESDIDVDSVFSRLPKELQLGQHGHLALGGFATNDFHDDGSEMTEDFFNFSEQKRFRK